MSKFVLIALLLLAVFSLRLESQQPLVGVIEGTVEDQQHAPLANVTITVTNIDSVDPESHRRQQVTDSHGFYHFIDVSEGRYSIAAGRKGYRGYTIPEVKVRGGETVKAPDIQMSRNDGNKK